MKLYKQLFVMVSFFGVLLPCAFGNSEDISKVKQLDGAKINSNASPSVLPPVSVSPSAKNHDHNKQVAVGVEIDKTHLRDISLILAGMRVDPSSPYANIENRKEWLEHEKFFNERWDKLTADRLVKMQTWAQEEIEPNTDPFASVLYFFGGPDLVNVSTVYPKAQNYLLCGLEPLGKVPDLESLKSPALAASLMNLRDSLKDNFDSSFFITREMMSDLHRSELSGVLPIFYFFAARIGAEIVDLEYITTSTSDSGTLMLVDDPSNAKGFKMSLNRQARTPQGQVYYYKQNAYYFRVDLSDKAYSQNKWFFDFAAQFDNANSYLKAASYLMHSSEFSKVRSFLLEHSHALLQDDSGIPLKFFEGWNKTFYGNYSAPITEFSWCLQPDLRKAFNDGVEKVKPLPFKTGYGKVTKSNLMFAIAPEKKS